MWMRNAFLVITSLYIFTSLPAQVPRQDSRLSKKGIAAFDTRNTAIERELRRGNQPDWAGEYYYGDGLGVNVSLKLSPRAGFAFTWDGCLGRYDSNFGEVNVENSLIRLVPVYPNQRVGFQGIDTELLPITWGERHYLIPSHRLLEFVNAINGGLEPADWRGGMSPRFLLKRGDEGKAVHGEPNVPDEYLTYILPKPVKATITSVAQTDVTKSQRITTVVLNVGAETGLKKGMELFVSRPRVYSTATVTTVGEHFSQAVFEQFDRSDRSPSVGWILSSKLGEQ
jgi:hypothetical protein